MRQTQVRRQGLERFYTTVQACSQKVTGKGAMGRRISTIMLNSYQSTGIAKGDGSRQSLENHGKLDEIRKFGEDHDVHRNWALAEDYSKPTKRGEHQNLSGMMMISYNPFFDPEAETAHINFEVAELLSSGQRKTSRLIRRKGRDRV